MKFEKVKPKIGGFKARKISYTSKGMMFECTKCHKVKSEKEFYKNKTQAHGIRPTCKICFYPNRKYKGMTPADILKQIKRK